MGACVLGFAAGALGTLSPCVLPLLPLVVAGAVERHRLGPLVLAAGLAAYATIVGLSVALLGFTLDRDVVRIVAGVFLVLVGAAVLAAYSVGAVAPVLLLAYGSRRLVARPDRLARVTRVGKPAVGALLVLFGVLSVTGADKAIETRLLDVMPAWLVELTTRL